MHHLDGTDPVRQVEGDHLGVRECLPESRDPGGAGAVAVADEQRVVIEPHGVAALDRRRRRHPRGNRNAGVLEARADAVRLAEPPFLAGPEQRRAVVSDENRVVDVDRVGIAGIVLGDDHLGARGREQRAELVVLSGGGRRIGDAAPAVALDVIRVGGERRTHEHPLQVTPHRLRAVVRHRSAG